MKTRKRQQKEEWDAKKKSVELKYKINKFINPSTTYRLFNNFVIRQQCFSNQVDQYVPHGAFFEFNKIIKGSIVGDYIKFTLAPILRQFQFNDDYIIQRFSSFGDQKSKTLAQTIRSIKESKNCIKDILDYLPKQKDLFQIVDLRKPVLMMYDQIQSLNQDLFGSQSYICISLEMMKHNGWNNAQQYILQCIKKGRLCYSFLMNSRSGTDYADRTNTKLSGLVKYIKQALFQKNLKQGKTKQTQVLMNVQQNQKLSFNPNIIQLAKLFRDHSQMIKIKHFQSPFAYSSQYQQIVSKPISQQQFDIKLLKDFGDQDETGIFQKLIYVPQNQLKRYEDRVCSFRDIETTKIKLQNKQTNYQ